VASVEAGIGGIYFINASHYETFQKSPNRQKARQLRRAEGTFPEAVANHYQEIKRRLARIEWHYQ